MTREIVQAEVVWYASIGILDCEGRSVQSRETTEHDTEGDARRWMVERDMYEEDKPYWGKSWRDHSNYRIGNVTRGILEIKEQPK